MLHGLLIEALAPVSWPTRLVSRHSNPAYSFVYHRLIARYSPADFFDGFLQLVSARYLRYRGNSTVMCLIDHAMSLGIMQEYIKVCIPIYAATSLMLPITTNQTAATTTT